MDCVPKTFCKQSITVAFMIDQLRHAVGMEIEGVNASDTSSGPRQSAPARSME